MPLAELEHPIAQELNSIICAAEMGLQQSSHLPEGTDLQYVSPFESSLGDHVVTYYDAVSNNFTSLRVPVFSDLNSGLTVITEDGVELTGARIIVGDLNGVTFKVRPLQEEMPFSAPHIQFDITEFGIILFAKSRTGDKAYRDVGAYEGVKYDSLSQALRTYTGMQKLHGAAIRHLADL